MTTDYFSIFPLCLGLLMSVCVCHAGEIVMDVPDNKPNSITHSGSDLIHSVSPASAVLIEDADEFSFFPQHGDDSMPESNAANSRKKAREEQSGLDSLPDGDAGNILILPSQQAAREGVAGNLSKARAYMKNNSSQRVSELPVVICDDTTNVSGRIGDDSQSGNVVTVLIKGKPVRVRCR